jgi:outer membrane receptor protein involved in Fe transport
LYTYKIDGSGHQLTADINYNTDKRNNNSNFVNYYYNPDGSSYSEPNRVRNEGDNSGNQLTVQVDYANPISENKKFETGIRSYYESASSLFNAFSQGNNGTETKLPLSNHYRFNQSVNAAYATFSNKIKKITYQAGLRAEISNFEGELVDKQEKFGYKYPASFDDIWNALFPSLFVTYNVKENEDIQVNYSRRIRRPDFWQLNPFIDIQDPVNIRSGNPEVRPEFTNSLELNYNRTYKSGNFLGTIYFRNTVGDITRYADTITEAQYLQLNNAAIDPNAILNTFINANYQNRLGLDLTLQQKIGKQCELIPNVNVQYRKVDAGTDKVDISNEGWGWEGKLVANYNIDAPKSWLFSNLGFQLTGEYESPRIIAQGRRMEQYSVNFALRKEMLKDKKATFTFSIDDVFNTRRWGSIVDTDNFYQESYRRWNVRSFRFTFSYRFGNPNFQMFKRGGDRNGDDDDGGNGMGGGA